MLIPLIVTLLVTQVVLLAACVNMSASSKTEGARSIGIILLGEAILFLAFLGIVQVARAVAPALVEFLK